MSAFLIALGAGCALQSTETQLVPEAVGWLEHVKVEVIATNDDCDYIEIVLPPGSKLGDVGGKLHLSDDTNRKLDQSRFVVSPRSLAGERRVKVLLPDLLVRDAVRLELDRLWVKDATWTWSPGLDGAHWATLNLPKEGGAAIRGEVNANSKEAWVAKAGPLDCVHVWKDRWVLPPAIIDHSGTDSPSEALADVSAWVLLPERPDLWGAHLPAAGQRGAGTPRNVAQTMVGRTERGPSPLQLAYAYPVGSTPDTSHEPPSATVAVRVDGDSARIWAHPDQPWSTDWRLWLPDGTGPLQPLGAPAADPSDPMAFARIRRELELRVPAKRSPQATLMPGAGSSVRTTEHIQLDDESRTRVWTLDLGDHASNVTIDVQQGGDSHAWLASTQDQVVLLASKGERPIFEVSWTSPDAPTCGEKRSEPGSWLTEVTVHGERAEIMTDGPFWWLASFQDVPMMDERARVVAGLYARFNGRTLPEPGLPLRLKGHHEGWDLAAQLRSALEERAVVLPPNGDELFPRRIQKARRSGVVTTVEAALIVRAFANQGHMQADWALVRPANRGDGHNICPVGHSTALVRIGVDDEQRWIDPGCELCAPFEVRPELQGGTAFGPWLTRGPEPTPGLHHVHVHAMEVTWTLEGPAALQLRRWLQTIDEADRRTALARRLAGDEATLGSIEGLAAPGEPITVRATAASADRIPGPKQWIAPQIQPDGSVWFDWVGERRFTRPSSATLPSADDASRILRATEVIADGMERRSLFVERRNMAPQRIQLGTAGWWSNTDLPAVASNDSTQRQDPGSSEEPGQ